MSTSHLMTKDNMGSWMPWVSLPMNEGRKSTEAEEIVAHGDDVDRPEAHRTSPAPRTRRQAWLSAWCESCSWQRGLRPSCDSGSGRPLERRLGTERDCETGREEALGEEQ
jgi:hypothetical protein